MQIYLQFSEREYLQGSKRLKDSAKFRLSEEKANVFALLNVRNLSKRAEKHFESLDKGRL